MQRTCSGESECAAAYRTCASLRSQVDYIGKVFHIVDLDFERRIQSVTGDFCPGLPVLHIGHQAKLLLGNILVFYSAVFKRLLEVLDYVVLFDEYRRCRLVGARNCYSERDTVCDSSHTAASYNRDRARTPH